MKSLKLLPIKSLIFLALLTVSISAQTVVKTDIPVNYRAKIAVGNSIIAYGTGVNNGVDYIKAGDKNGRGIAESEKYSALNFAVVGDKIVMMRVADFGYAVYDTATGKTHEISGLKNRGLTAIKASGNFVAMINADDKHPRGVFSVIDLSGSAPNVIVSQPAWKSALRLDQLAIDAAGGDLVVSSGEQIARIKFNTGDTEPIPFDLQDFGISAREPMAVTGGKVFYFSAESGQKNLMELDLSSGEIKKMSVNQATGTVAANAGTVAYFANRDAKDRNSTEARLVVMKPGGKPVIVVPTDKFVDGSTRNSGLHGFGSTIAVTPDGKHVFIAGTDAVGNAQRLQLYNGTTLKLFPDATNRPAFVKASDVVAGSSLAAFKVGTDAKTTLAYLKYK